jgi:hypothetical protein
MDVFGYHIPSLAVVAAAFSSVYAAFAKFDADQSDKNRQFVRQWLLGLKVDDGQWAQFFQELFSKAPSCTASKALASSISLRALASVACSPYPTSRASNRRRRAYPRRSGVRPRVTVLSG